MRKLLLLAIISFGFLTGVAYSDTVSSFVRSSWETNPGTTWDSMEDTTGWTAAGTGTSLSANTPGTNVKEKLGSVTMSVTGFSSSATFSKDMGAIDFTNIKNIVFWLRMTGANNLNSLTIKLSSVSNFSKSYSYTFTNPATSYSGKMHVRWQRMLAGLSAFTNNGSEDITSLRYVQFSLDVSAGQNASITIDDFAYDYSLDNAKIIFTFDDGYMFEYDNAWPILSGNDQKAVFFINSAYVNTSEGGFPRMTLKELHELYDAGNDLGNHSAEHLAADSITYAAQYTDMETGRDFLVNNGFMRSARIFAFPGGTYRDTLIGTLPNLFTSNVQVLSDMARSITQVPDIQPAAVFNENDTYADSRFLLPTVYVLKNTTTSSVISIIDQAIAAKGIVVLLFHKIIPDTESKDTDYMYWVSDFTTISDYVKTKQDSGDIDVVTMSDYYRSFLHGNR